MATDQGWIKLYRELLEKPIWKLSTPEQRSVLITMLLLANHEPAEWMWKGKKFIVEKGQFVTSLQSLASKAGKGISVQNVRSTLVLAEKHDFSTYKSTKSGRIITIINLDSYQGNNNKGQQRAQQRGNKGATTNKNDKNNKNNNSVDSAKKIYELYLSEINPGQKSKQRALSNISYYLKSYSLDNLTAAIKNYRSVCNDRDSKFKRDPANFFGKREKPFIDFLPSNFNQERSTGQQSTGSALLDDYYANRA